MNRTVRALLPLLLLACAAPAGRSAAADQAPAAHGPGPQDWADLARLPDWSGVWVPDVADQNAQVRSNPTPWTPDAQRKIDRMNADEDAGDPHGLFVDCLPEAEPSWMLINHNALEIVDLSNNLGDAKSLATHPSTTTHRSLTDEERAALGLTEGCVRLSVGLEGPTDLERDLARALDRA